MSGRITRTIPNGYQTKCKLCHGDVAPGAGLALKRNNEWRVLCQACVDDPDGALARGSRRGWVFVVRVPGEVDRVAVGCSRFPNLRCAQFIMEYVLARRRERQLPFDCHAWAIQVEDRFAARNLLRDAAADRKEANVFRGSLDEILAEARSIGINGEAVPVVPSSSDWHRSGQ